MAKRCGVKNGKSMCPKPRANWWKASMGVDWWGSSGGGVPVEGWVLTTGIWNNSEYWDNSAFYRNNP